MCSMLLMLRLRFRKETCFSTENIRVDVGLLQSCKRLQWWKLFQWYFQCHVPCCLKPHWENLVRLRRTKIWTSLYGCMFALIAQQRQLETPFMFLWRKFKCFSLRMQGNCQVWTWHLPRYFLSSRLPCTIKANMLSASMHAPQNMMEESMKKCCLWTAQYSLHPRKIKHLCPPPPFFLYSGHLLVRSSNIVVKS